ncbi:MAG: hypothetical protein C0604_07840 [Clostridiales bacterium]|nr:MAG: hypothetical protein C0604_07840 [Clostridiales bacterium]
MKFEIPEYGTYNIKNLVFDYNGTLAEDGIVKPEILRKLEELSAEFDIYVVTADTYGTVEKMFDGSSVEVGIISRENGSKDKESLVQALGAGETIAVGNGFNDRLMMKAAALGFCIAGPEGASAKAIMNSDVVLKSIECFFDLMDEPKRLIATLRG